jgi:hypothetical protein
MKLLTRKEIQAASNESLASLHAKEALILKAIKEKAEKLDLINLEFSKRSLDADRDRAEIELERKVITSSLSKELEGLEERKKEALAPIEKEMKLLEARRLEMNAKELSISEREQALASKDAELRSLKQSLDIRESNLGKTLEDTSKSFEKEKSEISKMTKEAQIFITRAKRERSLAEEMTREANSRMAEAVLLEQTSRASLIAIENRIEAEKREQSKTDEKRNMLKIALEVAKKKGVCLVPETQTK